MTSFVISCAETEVLRMILPFKQSHTMRTLFPKKNNSIIHYRIRLNNRPESHIGKRLPRESSRLLLSPIRRSASREFGPQWIRAFFLFFSRADTNILRGLKDPPIDEHSIALAPQRSAAISQAFMAVYDRVSRTTSIS